MKKYYLIFFHIIFLVFQDKHSDADTFISQRNGRDGASCGTIFLPCLSLQYALAYRVKPKEHIRLDGGEKKPYVYVVNKPIHITNEIFISSYQNNYIRPIIFMVNKKTYLFESRGEKGIKIDVRNIDFRNISLLILNNACNVKIVNCSFRDAPTAVLFRKIPKQSNWLETVTIYILNSNFFNSTATEICCIRNIEVVLKNCVFQGDKRYTLNIERISQHGVVNVTNCNIEAQGPKGPKLNFQEKCVSSVNVLNTTFFNSYFDAAKWGLHLSFCLNVVIEKSTFLGFKPAVYIRNVKNAEITHCNFTKNHGALGGAIRSSSSTFVANKCNFSYNTGYAGGAIYSINSVAKINQSIFYHNSALLSGGTVHAGSSRSFPPTFLFVQNSEMYATPTKGLTAGIIIRCDTKLYLTNVLLSILNSSIESPILEILNLDRSSDAYFSPKYLSNVNISCPRNYKVVLPSRNPYARCLRCPKGMYSIANDMLQIQKTIPKKPFIVVTNSNFSCIACPSGGRCEYNIQSRGNFWGYVKRNNQIRFLPCPSYYCCSRKCESYNDCNKYKEGILCGTCKKGFHLNYFNEDCVQNNDCHIISSWMLLTLYTVSYVLLLMYYKSVVTFLSNALSKLCSNKTKVNSSHSKGICNDHEQLLGYAAFLEDAEINDENNVIDNKEDNLTLLFGEETVEKELKCENEAMKNDINKSIIGSGIKTIFFFFYQMEILLHIPTAEEDRYNYLRQLKNAISNIFNLQMVQSHLSKLCFMENLDAVSKQIIKASNVFMLLLVLVVAVGIITMFSLIKKKVKSKCFEYFSKYQITDKIRNCFIQVALLGYTNVTTFCFTMLHCVEINNKKHLFIKGDVVCYTWWQYCILFVTLLWVLPFGVSICLSIKMLQEKKLRLKMFYITLVFPPVSFYYYLQHVCRPTTVNVSREELTKMHSICELFTGPFRSNISGQFNWESVIIIRRLLIAVICNFVVNPIARMLLTLPLLLSYLVHHLCVSPYRNKLLNRLETICLSSLLIINMENLLFAFLYMNDQSSIPGIKEITNVCVWIQHIILTAPLFILVVVVVVAIFWVVVVAVKKCMQRKQD